MLRQAYSVAGHTLTPILPLWLKRRAARGKEDAARMPERFGHATRARPAGTLCWLHAASMGETQSVLPLMRALLAAHPALTLLITTGTLTSAALVAQQQLPRVIHQFVPLDTPRSVTRFLNHWQPNLALWVESELWPQLVWQTHARRIPMLLLNARMSEASARGWQRFPRSIASLLQCFDTVYAREKTDAKRLQNLGAKNIREVGNLKYDTPSLTVDAAQVAALKTAIGTRPCIIAASTHAGEELQIAEVHTALLPAFPSLLTILIPRHASRGDVLAQELRTAGHTLAQRSAGEPITAETSIYLADTMGELGNFYALQKIVFMGGSLVPHGGQNLLEPARFGNALITGPYTHNFAEIVAAFAAANALSIVQHKQGLIEALTQLLSDDSARVAMANAALQQVQQCSGATDAILAHCNSILAQGTV